MQTNNKRTKSLSFLLLLLLLLIKTLSFYSVFSYENLFNFGGNMSSFFSLGGLAFGVTKDEQIQDQEDVVITPNSLHLFRNEEIRNKEFEIWQQYYQLHNNTAAGNSNSNSNSNINSNNIPTAVPCWKMIRQGEYGVVGGEYVADGGGGSGSSNSGINCQDCGNQAKKDCQHMRCRTCCRSRGFQCQTHVKSTWVPAAKRRERQQQQLGLVMRSGGTGGGGDDQNSKRLREDHHFITTGLNLPSTTHHHHQSISSSGLETGHFPAEVNSPAIFRCVKVSAMNVAEEQLAYQTTVSIGGHVFKGILYDHGPGGGESSTSSVQHQQLNLITAGTSAVNPNASSVDPSTILPTPLNAFMVGTQFFPPPRS